LIYFDHPQNWPRRAGLPPGLCAHLVSDLHGEEGTRELVAFGARLGMRERWLQSRGTYREHFDLFGRLVDDARAAGAVELNRRDFVGILRAKRALLDPPFAK
jgi:hypothetical protein